MGTLAGFQSQALFDYDGESESRLGLGLDEWYAWLSGTEEVNINEHVTDPESSRTMLQSCMDLKDLLSKMLAKQPDARLSSFEFRRHPFVTGVFVDSMDGSIVTCRTALESSDGLEAHEE